MTDVGVRGGDGGHADRTDHGVPPAVSRGWSPRQRHYGDFYGVSGRTGPGGGRDRDRNRERPTVWVHGNCQAESLRSQLDADDLDTVRVPPAHELTRDDLPFLARLLARTDVLVTQPVRAGYRGLPIGTADLISALPAGARTAVVPVIRFAGLYPAQALVRPPADPGLSPPVVAYHDLRTLARAAGSTSAPPLTPARVHAVAEQSRRELRARESRHETVVVSDVFDRPAFAAMRTINHPGNDVWTVLAARVRARLGLPPRAVCSDEPLLDSVHAPREPAVVEAFGLDEEPRSWWVVERRRIADEEVREAQLRWYAERPDVVEAGMARHGDTLALLGLGR